MKKIQMSEVMDLVVYEKAREAMRAAVIALKKNRRLSLGDRLSLLFENRQTVLFQIQEMIRTERIVDDGKIRDEVDTYNGLIPDEGELSATLFIEIPELVHLKDDEVRGIVNRFQGLDRDSLWLVVGEHRLPAIFEPLGSNEEKMAAVHYLRFRVPESARKALADPACRVALLAAHPNYRAETELSPAVRGELLTDLGQPSTVN